LIWRLLQRIRAVRLLAAVLVGCFLLAACNTLLPHGFEFTFENGNQCAKGGDCASGFCSVDSLCCAEVCSGPCQSCKGGETCSSVPKDSKGACTGDEVCSAEGLCYCSNQGFLGSPTGRIVYFAGVGPSSVAALDLNGDGKPDLAVANGIDNTLSVLLSKGDGTFRLPSSVFRLPSSVFRAPLSCACACALWIRIPKRARARARGPRTKTEERKTKDGRRRTADDEYRTNQERAPPYACLWQGTQVGQEQSPQARAPLQRTRLIPYPDPAKGCGRAPGKLGAARAMLVVSTGGLLS